MSGILPETHLHQLGLHSPWRGCWSLLEMVFTFFQHVTFSFLSVLTANMSHQLNEGERIKPVCDLSISLQTFYFDTLLNLYCVYCICSFKMRYAYLHLLVSHSLVYAHFKQNMTLTSIVSRCLLKDYLLIKHHAYV